MEKKIISQVIPKGFDHLSSQPPNLPLSPHLECEFFESPVGLPEVLSGLGVAALLGVKLSLELADAGFQLGDDALASLEGGSLGLVEAGLEEEEEEEEEE